MKILNKKINDLLSLSVFFSINEFVGLEFHHELEARNDFSFRVQYKFIRSQLNNKTYLVIFFCIKLS